MVLLFGEDRHGFIGCHGEVHPARQGVPGFQVELFYLRVARVLPQGRLLLILQGCAGGERLQAPRDDAVHGQVVRGRRDGAVRGRHLGQLALQELEDYINV